MSDLKNMSRLNQIDWKKYYFFVIEKVSIFIDDFLSKFLNHNMLSPYRKINIQFYWR